MAVTTLINHCADCALSERLTITATHTHTAPMLKNVCPTIFGVPIPEGHQANIDRYTEEFTDHLEAVATVKQPEARECDECVKTGSTWVHLRTCQTCGGTRCCDSSPNKHASRHAAEAAHPIVRSAERGEDWSWCYVDEVAFVAD